MHLHEIMMKVRKAEKELANDLRREPTKQEVANKAGISEAKLHGLHKVTISWLDYGLGGRRNACVSVKQGCRQCAWQLA